MTRKRCTGVAEVDPRSADAGVLNPGHLRVGFNWLQCVPPETGRGRIDHPPLPNAADDRAVLLRWMRESFKHHPNNEARTRAIENGDYLEILGTCTAEEPTP